MASTTMEDTSPCGQLPASFDESPTVDSGLPSQPRSRRGHKKSRNGCSACRRRKIKCSETRPACASCVKYHKACEYPAGASKRAPMRSIIPQMSLQMQMHSMPTILKTTDLHLFDHFRKTAYPYLPTGNDEVWTTEIARLAQTNEFLAHAVLGLAASHLSFVSIIDLSSAGLAHRVSAMTGLKRAFSSAPKTKEEGDALLAACYALAMQSIYIGENVAELFTMLRGCHVIMSQSMLQNTGTSFVSPQAYCLNNYESDPLPVVDPRRYTPGIESLLQLEPLCTGALEAWFHGSLLEIVRLLGVSSHEAGTKFGAMCQTLPSLPDHLFSRLVDPSNMVSQLLLMHYAAVLVLMYPIKCREWNNRDMGKPTGTTVYRMDVLKSKIPESLHRYTRWPMEIRLE